MTSRQSSRTPSDRAAPEAERKGAALRPPVRQDIGGEAPPIVHDVLSGSGQALSAEQRRPFENQLGRDFSDVRVHADSRAGESADAVAARAYTVGRHIVFNQGAFAPGTPSGKQLLAHELTHVGQQSGTRKGGSIGIGSDDAFEAEARSGSGKAAHSPSKVSGSQSVLQRVPAAPSWKGDTAVYDRSQVDITPLSDITVSGATIPSQTATPTISAAGATHLSWELYDPADKFITGSSTITGTPDALTRKFVVTDADLKSNLVQGRYRLRCIARKHGTPLAYADQTFFLNTTKPLAGMNRTELGGIAASPSTHSLGEVGAAKARDMMLEHQASLASGGGGTLEGNKCPTVTPGVSRSDCTQYVYDILKYAFGAKGEGAKWAAVAAEAAKLSGSGGLRGTALQTALETQAGWKGVFWAPSPRNPEDGTSEHPTAYKRVREKGLYTKDDVAVDAGNSVIDYRPKSTTKMPEFTKLDQLKKAPLGVISARGGRHMTLIINGQVYEVHWDLPATDPNVIQATPLEKWQWESGAIVMPASDYAAAFP